MHRRTNDAVADGEVVWFWPPDAEAKLAGVTNTAGDGSKKARFPGPVPGEITYKPGAPSRRECRMIRLILW